MLIASVSRRDRLAFKRVYEQTSTHLFGIVLRIVRNRALAEEVLQEVYLRIWEKASTYRKEAGSPITWMISIARNRAIDVIRRRSEVFVDPGESGEDWLEGVAAVGDDAADMADRDSLQHCLDHLDEQQRNCIVLAYCSGYSRDELAMRFERPVNTIKTWLHRGLASLRTCLEAQ